jgi:hypothetical protein
MGIHHGQDEGIQLTVVHGDEHLSRLDDGRDASVGHQLRAARTHKNPPPGDQPDPDRILWMDLHIAVLRIELTQHR